MEIAKVTSKGQITVPKEVREKLNLETGSKIVFLQVGDELVVRNANQVSASEINEPMALYRLGPDALPAFRRLQEAFAGLAEEEGITNEEELVDWMKDSSDNDAE